MKTVLNYCMKKMLSEQFSRFLVFLGFVIIVISVILFAYKHDVNTNEQIDSSLLDNFGSFISGSVGSLWALAGVVLFYVALEKQKEALQLQKTELDLTRKELKGQREEFEKQNETLSQQRFENTFFSLLKAQQDIRDNLEVVGGFTYRGHRYFNERVNKFRRTYNELSDKIKESEKIEKTDNSLIKFWGKEMDKYKVNDVKSFYSPSFISRVVYSDFYNENHIQLGHYFRHLYHVLRFVRDNEDNELNPIERELYEHEDSYEELIEEFKTEEERIKKKYAKYAQYIQAQMSSGELLLLFYNALFFPKMKEMIYRYKLLDGLNVEDLLNPEFDIEFYKGESFVGGAKYLKLNFKSRNSILKP
ncbi:hypothetical protein CAP35_11090 [Chitinophagaceae bacterium IBVUCB1]|nr:hypothetical protein CAP35_11090 [Chitinophagaceae bacterium IBVUCB1]